MSRYVAVSLQNISIQCKVSLEAAYRRFSTLIDKPSALVIHNKTVFQRFIRSNDFNFFINRLSLSESQKDCCIDINIEKYPDSLNLVDARDWLDTKNKRHKLKNIYSSTISLYSDYTYTLLTYDDGCFS